ncbi:MAG: purine-nucleoside phosphorylase [Candidatus Zambryskibacteria bacterium]|nr:purine-nucleoside phosphorylase [Candidatus Zambryskibacteria bacterium]
MSIHIEAEPGQIAETVLLPGDPLRAEYIAKKFLNHDGDPVLYNKRRNMLGYTGTDFRGRRISVQGSGMGMPSLGIYVHELIHSYGVKRIIRVGTCGAYDKSLKLGDIILVEKACRDEHLTMPGFSWRHVPSSSVSLLIAAARAASNHGIRPHEGRIHSTDVFYDPNETDLLDDMPRKWQCWAAQGVLGVEMESAELFERASRNGVEALSILAVSDRLFDFSTQMSAEDRVRSADITAQIALGI